MGIWINRMLDDSSKLVKVGDDLNEIKCFSGENEEVTSVVATSHSHLMTGTRIWVSQIVMDIVKKTLLTRYKPGFEGMGKINKGEPQVNTFIETLLNFGDKECF